MKDLEAEVPGALHLIEARGLSPGIAVVRLLDMGEARVIMGRDSMSEMEQTGPTGVEPMMPILAPALPVELQIQGEPRLSALRSA